MADYIARIQFVSLYDLADWHETWYTTAADAKTAKEQAILYIKERQKSLADQIVIRRVTVSNVAKFRDVDVKTGSWGRSAGDAVVNKAPELNPPDFPDAGWLCQFFANDQAWRHICFRGLSDRWLGGVESAAGRAAFDEVFKELLKVIAGPAKFTIRVKADPAVAKVNTAITYTDEVVTIVTADNHGMVVGDKVVVRGVNGPKVNGTYRVATKISDTSFTFLKRGIEPRDLNAKGTSQKLSYTYAPIATGEPIRVSNKKTRIPFVGRRGRSRRKK